MMRAVEVHPQPVSFKHLQVNRIQSIHGKARLLFHRHNNWFYALLPRREWLFIGEMRTNLMARGQVHFHGLTELGLQLGFTSGHRRWTDLCSSTTPLANQPLRKLRTFTTLSAAILVFESPGMPVNCLGLKVEIQSKWNGFLTRKLLEIQQHMQLHGDLEVCPSHQPLIPGEFQERIGNSSPQRVVETQRYPPLARVLSSSKLQGLMHRGVVI